MQPQIYFSYQQLCNWVRIRCYLVHPHHFWTWWELCCSMKLSSGQICRYTSRSNVYQCCCSNRRSEISKYNNWVFVKVMNHSVSKLDVCLLAKYVMYNRCGYFSTCFIINFDLDDINYYPHYKDLNQSKTLAPVERAPCVMRVWWHTR